MRGLFIPEITAEMFRNGCLESIEALMAEGEIYDIEYSRWIPVSERLPEDLEPCKRAVILGKAIKALEQQTCEDAVSRKAVLDIFADNADATRPYSTAWEEVKALPSVNPQPKIGHWIQTQEKDDAEPCILWECSECHKEFHSVVHKVSNYCPSCGCRIVETQERSDKE